jgi:hypothetical protein
MGHIIQGTFHPGNDSRHLLSKGRIIQQEQIFENTSVEDAVHHTVRVHTIVFVPLGITQHIPTFSCVYEYRICKIEQLNQFACQLCG